VVYEYYVFNKYLTYVYFTVAPPSEPDRLLAVGRGLTIHSLCAVKEYLNPAVRYI
jgi:hypothetical protein